MTVVGSEKSFLQIKKPTGYSSHLNAMNATSEMLEELTES